MKFSTIYLFKVDVQTDISIKLIRCNVKIQSSTIPKAKITILRLWEILTNIIFSI